MMKESNCKQKPSMKQGGMLTSLSALGHEYVFSSAGTWVLRARCKVCGLCGGLLPCWGTGDRASSLALNPAAAPWCPLLSPAASAGGIFISSATGRHFFY